MPALHDRKALYQLAGVMAILIFTTTVGLYDGQRYGQLYIFGYIMAVVYAVDGPLRRNRPWSDLGIKRGFRKDFRRVWYYFGIDGLLFQILPPTLGVAYVFGYYGQELQQISGRLASDFASVGGVSVFGGMLVLMAVLTLMEELVFRVTIQERLSWFIGTRAAILVTTCMFALVHAVGVAGSLQVTLIDVLGVAIDGAFFGLIYAKTHNLAVTWVTHYTADVVGLLSLIFIL